MQSSSLTLTTDGRDHHNQQQHPQQRHFGTEISQLQNQDDFDSSADRQQLACFSGQKDQAGSNPGSSSAAKRSYHTRSASIASSFNEEGLPGGRTTGGGGLLGTFIDNITEESEQQLQTEREQRTSVLAPDFCHETEEEFLASGNELLIPKSPNTLHSFVQGQQQNKSSSFPLTLEDLNVDKQRREIVKLIKENDYLQQRLRMQEAAIKSKDAELEELSEYFNSLQERYFRKQDECAQKLSEDEFQMKELEFQLQMQREEMQLQIDVSNQQLVSQRSEFERLHQEITSLKEQLAIATLSPRFEESQDDGPILAELIEETEEEEEQRQDCDETIDSQVVSEVSNMAEGKKIGSSDDDGKWVWVHNVALLAWASTICLIFVIALSKEF